MRLVTRLIDIQDEYDPGNRVGLRTKRKWKERLGSLDKFRLAIPVHIVNDGNT